MSARIRLLLVLLIVGGLAGAQDKATAGRVWSIGEALPDTLLQSLLSDAVKSPAPDAVLLLVFTRADQRLSDRIEGDLKAVLTKPLRDRIFIIQVVTGSSAKTDRAAAWYRIGDPDHHWYDTFGVRVLPTIFVLGPDRRLASYLPGYTPATASGLNSELAVFFPELFPPEVEVAFAAAEKQRLRKESLARKLYYRFRYQLALGQLDGLDSLSVKGQVLKGFIYLKLEDFSAAEEIFQHLLDDPNGAQYGQLGLGLIAFNRGEIEVAEKYLYGIHALPEMYRIHYWRGRIMEALGRTEEAAREYRQSSEQAASKLAPTFLP
ncbi:MAG: tetratricopeptide repeat protein [Candidatus Neomarinimicrobiota bacterium]